MKLTHDEALEIIAQRITPNWIQCQYSQFCTVVIWSKAERILQGEGYLNMLNATRRKGKIHSESCRADIEAIEEVKKMYGNRKSKVERRSPAI